MTLHFWIYKYIGLTLLSLFFVWICNRAQGSILVAGIAHAASNTVEALVPIQDGLVLYPVSLVAALVMILADRMWVKLPPDYSGEHPAVYREPALNDR